MVSEYIVYQKGDAMNTNDKLKKIIEAYGEDSQVHIAIEEMSELVKALLKYRRAVEYGGDAEKCKAHITEEMADVWIMLFQLELIFRNADAIRSQIEYKIERQLKRIKEEKE